MDIVRRSQSDVLSCIYNSMCLQYCLRSKKKISNNCLFDAEDVYTTGKHMYSALKQ